MTTFLRLYAAYIEAEQFDTKFDVDPEWLKFIDSSKATGGHTIVSGQDAVIQVIGVWDTVGALGIPDFGHFITVDNSKKRKKFEFYDADLTPGK